MKGETSFAAIYSPGIADAGIARHFSPRVETIDRDTVVLDVSGMSRLVGGPYDIARAILKQAGPKANVAIAGNANAAIYAARGYPGIVVIPPGEEAARLGGLPVTLLDTTTENLNIINRWGIRTFRDLAALPEIGLVERLGQEGRRLRLLALGTAEALLKADEPEKVYSATMDLEDPVSLLEPLSFILSRLLNDVCLELQSNGLAAIALSLHFVLEQKQTHERKIQLPVPSRNPVAFLKLLQLDLEARPVSAPIYTVTLTAEPTKPRSVQEGLFVPPTPNPEKLELTLQRLTALVGAGNVGSPQVVDTHRPEAFRVGPALQPPETMIQLAPGTIALRVFRPPRPAKVHPHGGPPERVDAGTIRGEVLFLAGPWRSSGDWWTQTPWARDDFDLALTDGALYRLYFERFSKSWYLAGRYD